MNINFKSITANTTMQPILLEGEYFDDIQIAGSTLKELISSKIYKFIENGKSIAIYSNFWPSDAILEKLFSSKNTSVILDENKNIICEVSNGKKSSDILELEIDEKSILIKYPWELLDLNSEVIGNLDNNFIYGEVRPNATIDGNVIIGRNTVILPGVYIEGNAIIGDNCKIGPNCYIRGNTFIGSNCHIGQATEIKNSLLMDNVAAGHLTYIGDSVVGENTNFGAGTITANFRHDGKNHRSAVNDKIIDTGRRKFGTIIGSNVHTGIHTSIYPGRKIGRNASTLPGTIVKKDIKSRVY